MFEVEMKFRLKDPEQFERKIRDFSGGEFSEPHIEEDLYFQRLSRDFRETGEALRIRRIEEELMITYKGPRRDDLTKMREEIELPLRFNSEEMPADDRKKEWIRLISRLGCEPFAEVRKSRKTLSFVFEGRSFTVTRDSLAELGEFTEIETLVESEADLPAARGKITGLAALFELNELVYSSYLTLLLKKREK